VLLKDIHFANGVQLSKDESFVLVSEACRFRIWKYYLKGKKAGQSEIFIDGLPGPADNIRSDERGGFLVGINIQRTAEHPSAIDRLSNLPLLRKFILRITTVMYTTVSFVDSIFPTEYTGQAKYYINHLEPTISIHPSTKSIVLQLDENGKIKSSLQNSENGQVRLISEATIDEEGEYAYLGSPYNHGIWRIKVKDMGLK